MDVNEADRCTICQETFTLPVVASDGFTYDAHCLERWVQQKPTSPFTHAEFNLPQTTVNINACQRLGCSIDATQSALRWTRNRDVILDRHECGVLRGGKVIYHTPFNDLSLPFRAAIFLFRSDMASELDTTVFDAWYLITALRRLNIELRSRMLLGNLVTTLPQMTRELRHVLGDLIGPRLNPRAMTLRDFDKHGIYRGLSRLRKVVFHRPLINDGVWCFISQSEIDHPALLEIEGMTLGLRESLDPFGFTASRLRPWKLAVLGPDEVRSRVELLRLTIHWDDPAQVALAGKIAARVTPGDWMEPDMQPARLEL